MANLLAATNLSSGQSVKLDTGNIVGGALNLSVVVGGGHVLDVTNAKTNAGQPAPATPATGNMGIARTSGASLQLLGEVASSGANASDQALWQFNLPTTYQGGTAIPITVNGLAAGSGTIVASGTTLGVAAFVVSGGVETPLTVTGGSQALPGSATTLSWSVGSAAAASANLSAGTNLVVEITAAVQVSSGTRQATINTVSYTA